MTGSTPGMPMQTGQVAELGGRPNCVLQPQNSLVLRQQLDVDFQADDDAIRKVRHVRLGCYGGRRKGQSTRAGRREQRGRIAAGPFTPCVQVKGKDRTFSRWVAKRRAAAVLPAARAPSGRWIATVRIAAGACGEETLRTRRRTSPGSRSAPTRSASEGRGQEPNPSLALWVGVSRRQPEVLRQNLLHHAPRHVGQAEVAAGVAERQLLVVQPQQVQDRGVEVVDVDGVLGDVDAVVVGGADGRGRP